MAAPPTSGAVDGHPQDRGRRRRDDAPADDHAGYRGEGAPHGDAHAEADRRARLAGPARSPPQPHRSRPAHAMRQTPTGPPRHAHRVRQADPPGARPPVLAPFAVDQAACLRADGEQRVDSSASSDSVGWTVTDTCTTATKIRRVRPLCLPKTWCFRHQLLLPRPYLVLTKPLRLDIQSQRGASVKIGWKYLDD